MNEEKFILTVTCEKNLTKEDCSLVMKDLADRLQGYTTTIPDCVKDACINLTCESFPYVTGIFSEIKHPNRYDIAKEKIKDL